MAGETINQVFRGAIIFALIAPLAPNPAQSTAAGDMTGPKTINGGGASPVAGVGVPASAFLGSMLFTRCVSGTRVVPRGQHKSVGGVGFTGYGASVAGYPHDYLTAACAVGLSVAELDEFLLRLDKTLRKAKGEKAAAVAAAAVVAATSPEEDATVRAGTRTGAGVAAKASQGDAAGENGHHRHRGGGAEPVLNGSQTQPETSLPGCVEAEGGGEDWDGVD